jgi:site-specific DNA-cytosine methylase
MPLKKRLKDMLEDSVNERYYLSETAEKYELSDKMKAYINSYDDKYKVGDGNLVVNRDVACSKTTREGSTRADASDYISNDFGANENIAGKDVVPYRIRKLTPKECWRLMGFADEDVDSAISAGMSNAQLYKQAGNSIVVNVLEGIFGEML